MKKLISILFLGTNCLVADFYDIKPIKITKDITCVIGDFHPPTKQNKGFVSNICYVNIGDSLVLLDAGPSYNFAKQLDGIIKKDYPNKKISHVVLSNYHDDRISGAQYFKNIGAKIVGHKSINDDIKNNPKKFERMPSILPKEVYANTTIINADTLVDNGYKIKGTKKELTILKLSEKAQEFSDIVILSEDDKFLFAGNYIFNGRLVRFGSHSNVNNWIEDLEKIGKMDLKYIVGGHGKEYDNNSYIPTMKYLKIIKDQTTKAYENDVELDEIVKHVDTSEFNYMNHYADLNGKNIYNYYMKLEWE